jgi:hypothetical protein
MPIENIEDQFPTTFAIDLKDNSSELYLSHQKVSLTFCAQDKRLVVVSHCTNICVVWFRMTRMTAEKLFLMIARFVISMTK